jgi:hypothetical protein
MFFSQNGGFQRGYGFGRLGEGTFLVGLEVNGQYLAAQRERCPDRLAGAGHENAESEMSENSGNPSPSKIVAGSEGKSSRKPSGHGGGMDHSVIGVVACVLPIVAIALAFLLGGVLGGGDERSRYYTLGILLLFFLLGTGAGIGLGAYSNPRKYKLAPSLAVIINVVLFLFIAFLSVASPRGPDQPGVEELPALDTLGVSSPESGTGG